MAETNDKKARKPKARNSVVIMAAIDERLRMIDADDFHAKRLFELMDELTRSLSKNGEKEAEGE